MYIPEILLAILVIEYFITLPLIFKKAGQDSWKGFVPILNFITWLKVVNRPWWWIFLIFIPGVNLLVLTVLHVELSIVFNKRSVQDQWIAGLVPWFFMAKMAFIEKDLKYVGPRDWSKTKKSFAREWGEAIVFAIIAASVIRAFFLEAFTIPTPSMEGSMLVGDYLFVSKMSYGPKSPQTPMSIPFMHNTIPGTMTDSYTEWFSMPYFRLPGFGSVERDDAVVFNFPHGDTVVVDPYYAGHDYYGILRDEAMYVFAKGYEKYAANPEKYKELARKNLRDKNFCAHCKSYGNQAAPNGLKTGGLKHRPIDKKENYVKRCVALPGDNIEIINRQLHIDGVAVENPENLQYNYNVTMKSVADINKIADNISLLESETANWKNYGVVPLTNSEFENIKKMSNVVSAEIVDHPYTENNYEHFFPNMNIAPFNTWSVDNYGPVKIPAKGETLELTEANWPLYKRAIEVYENNSFEKKDDGIYINGEKSNSYTFKQNYYWLMGDNRHNSADSRFWGFVPEDHVVGKAVFTWFSKEDQMNHGSSDIRWERMFRLVE